MKKGRPAIYGEEGVAIRVVFAKKDYEQLEKTAALERTDIAALVRRAVAHFYLIPAGLKGTKNVTKHPSETE